MVAHKWGLTIAAALCVYLVILAPGCKYESLIAVHYHAAEQSVAHNVCTTQPSEPTAAELFHNMVKQ